jgi:hypothetical protein
MYNYVIIHTHMPLICFIPEGVAEASKIFPRDAHVLPKLISFEEYCSRDRWSDCSLSQV